jgi:hypothetical protein
LTKLVGPNVKLRGLAGALLLTVAAPPPPGGCHTVTGDDPNVKPPLLRFPLTTP